MKNCTAEQRRIAVILFAAILYIILSDAVSYAQYIEIGNGIILDKNHSLLWQQSDDGVIRNYYDALQYCNDLDIGEATSWMLPSKWDLSTLIDLNFTPTINPVFLARSSDYLTSDYRSGICIGPGYNGGGSTGYSYSYIINFNDGSVSDQPIISACGMNAVIGYTRCTSEYKPSKPSLSPIINLLLGYNYP